MIRRKANDGKKRREKANEGNSSPLAIVVRRVRMRLADHVAATGAIRPVFPGAPSFRRMRFVTGSACSDLAFGQRNGLAGLHGRHLHPRIARQIDRKPHHLDDRARRGRKAVAAHQRDAAFAQAFRQPCVQVVLSDVSRTCCRRQVGPRRPFQRRKRDDRGSRRVWLTPLAFQQVNGMETKRSAQANVCSQT